MEHQMTETENSLFPRGMEVDISAEVYRLYRFPKGETVMIKKPKTLIVDERGTHNVVDKEGYSHTVPEGWLHLKFKVEKGAPHFYFQSKQAIKEKQSGKKPAPPNKAYEETEVGMKEKKKE